MAAASSSRTPRHKGDGHYVVMLIENKCATLPCTDTVVLNEQRRGVQWEMLCAYSSSGRYAHPAHFENARGQAEIFSTVDLLLFMQQRQAKNAHTVLVACIGPVSRDQAAATSEAWRTQSSGLCADSAMAIGYALARRSALPYYVDIGLVLGD
jgi:hypothetical protein